MGNTFRTTIEAETLPIRMGYSTPMLLLGSCFAQNIGDKLRSLKFPVTVNPLGVIYNPISVGQTLERIVSGEYIAEEDLYSHNDLWFSFIHHTELSSGSKEECLSRVNSTIQQAHSTWLGTEFLVVTFGTARTYFLRDSNEPVANCHKLPASMFVNRMLSVNEITTQWSAIINRTLQEKPNLKVLLTVSPIRHWKDGAVGNLRSKATLILAIHNLIEQFPNTLYYFPAYEIMMDDLRDYRFYASDMLHPSEEAIQYIWGQFCRVAIGSEGLAVSKRVGEVIRAVSHRPRRTDTKEFLGFCRRTIELIESIEGGGTPIDLSKEKEVFKEYLNCS